VENTSGFSMPFSNDSRAFLLSTHYRKTTYVPCFFLNSSVPRNITHICSSVPKPMKVNETDEYMPGMFVG
jgi:hypothetical protein